MATWEQTRKALEDLLNDVEVGTPPRDGCDGRIIITHVQIIHNVHYHSQHGPESDRPQRRENQP